ncbi:MAG: hypothetical protein V1733_07760 [bacterium]
MKSTILFLLVTGALLVFSCSKKEDPPPAPVNYTVDYQLLLTGGYTDLKIEYYETGLNWQELTNPTLPWQAAFTNFVQGDSVKMEFRFLTVPGTNYNYTMVVKVTKGGSVIAIDSSSMSATNVPVVIPIQDQWGYKIP